MKKKILVCLCVCASPFLLGVGSSFAAVISSSQVSTTAGGLVTIGTAPLQTTFSPSPNVLIAAKLSASAYAITSTNAVTDTTNGQEYGVLSSGSGYAQRNKTVAASAAVTTPTDEKTLPGTWTWMGGSGS